MIREKKKKEIKKPFKMFNNFYKKKINNFNSDHLKKNYDLNKLKIQNHKFSVIDELDEEIKGDTIQDNNINIHVIKKENKTKNNSKNKDNSKVKDKKGNEKEKNKINVGNDIINNSPFEIDQNSNKNSLKNNNISMISNDTINNEIVFTDKKLLTSFFSTSTFNNDLVNYKPIEKSSSNFINNNINNSNINNDNNTIFSIINNSSIPKLNMGNANTNSTVITETNNNSKLKEKLTDSLPDVIHLKPEKEEDINFLIENNSKVINEKDSNDISDISPL